MSVSGALKGATSGATMGAPLGLPGVAIGAGIGAIGGAIATKKTPLEKQQAAMLKADLERMKNGELGLNAAQKQQAISQDTEAAGRNVAAQQMQMGQLAAANPFAAGKIQQASRAGSEQLAQTGAQSSQNVDRLSAQIAEQEASRIKGELSAQNEATAKERKQTVAALGEFSQQNAAAIDVLKSSGLLDQIEDTGVAAAEPAAAPDVDPAQMAKASGVGGQLAGGEAAYAASSLPSASPGQVQNPAAKAAMDAYRAAMGLPPE
jgi:hypothetical protein